MRRASSDLHPSKGKISRVVPPLHDRLEIRGDRAREKMRFLRKGDRKIPELPGATIVVPHDSIGRAKARLHVTSHVTPGGEDGSHASARGREEAGRTPALRALQTTMRGTMDPRPNACPPELDAQPNSVIHVDFARPPEPARALFDLPPSVRWADITIYPMNGETIGVAIAGARPRHFHAVEIGMAHKITRNPTVSFELLVHLCAHGGRADWRTARFAEEAPIAFDNFPAFKMQAYALRRSLRRIFGIASDPYSVFGTRKGLVTAFRAMPAAPGEMRYLARAYV